MRPNVLLERIPADSQLAPDPLHPLEPDQGPSLTPGMLIGQVDGPQPLELRDLEEVGLGGRHRRCGGEE